ncbi:SCO family protein [Paracoccus stylophorae]|uniref:SCO family protein n=1 Tax=Paracoccus stylophorae TaxID=659350 RepID=A0ABY7STU9_9RHOB|nr:SCO family protein [Paracoccus stylophorae]WCR09837.1 SCO family protein [Paracoccus stylophorae]
MRRRALFVGGTGAALAFTLGLGWWRVDGPGRPAQASRHMLLPLPLREHGWTLTDHKGATVRPQDWVGRPTLAFLGFTHCPDVCPTTLSDISLWLEELGTDADRLNVALISVDPERDTPEVLADYLDYFDPRIVGLTGTQAEVARILADFRAKAARIEDGEGYYTMNHTAGVFMFRADGSFGSIIDFHEDRRFAVPKIRRAMDKEQP